MNKEDIVKRFLEEGYMISPAVLLKINESNIDEFLERARSGAGPIIKEPEEKAPEKSYDALKRGGAEKKKEITEASPEDGLLIDVKALEEKERLAPDDFIAYYNNKYNGLKEILLKRIAAVSINKANRLFSGASIIGMVRELTPKGLVAEDPTGSIEVVLGPGKEMPGVGVDDVIGIRGTVRETRLFADEVVFPDIPLTNTAGSADATIFLATGITDKLKEAAGCSTVLLKSDSGEGAGNITSNPARATLSKGGKEVKLLVYEPGRDMDRKQALNLLRKRHLSPGRNSIRSQEDPYLIKPIPDILWILSNTKAIEIYKGVTIVLSREPVKIDLRTMKAEFVE